MIFGINLKNKVIANLLTGLTLAILSSALFKNFLFESNDEFHLSGLEIVSKFAFISDLSSFLIIKFRSKEILELNLEMKNYRRVYSIYKTRSFRPQIIAIIVWLICVSLLIILQILDPVFGETTGKLIFELEISDITRFWSFISFVAYTRIWKVLFRLIYHEMNIDYMNIIKDFSYEMKRKITAPDINCLRMTHKAVLDFINLQTALNKNVNFIKFYIIFNTILTYLSLIFWLIDSKETFAKFLTVIYAIVVSIYNLFIIYEVLNRKKFERELLIHLDRWKRIQFNEICIIELEVLERSFKILIDEH